MTKNYAASKSNIDHNAFASALRTSEVWIFDLDNTLYPPSFNLFAQIDKRMRTYIAQFLGVDIDIAIKFQKDYFREHGTSLRGLMDRHGMDPAPFLDDVHNIDVSVLVPSAELDTALERLEGRKIIYTNASERHAERVLEQLGIIHHFEGVFDIVAADYRPKPDPEPYGRLVQRFGIPAKRSVMVEDMARNLKPAAALGMTTVWVCNGSELGEVGADGDHIHHIIDDLPQWLKTIACKSA